MGFGLNMISHLACIYYVGRSYYYFRKSGGIKGLNPTTDLPEDKAIAKTTMKNCGVPVVPGSDGAVESIEDAIKITSKKPPKSEINYIDVYGS
mgnify:CR=1 FL=1